MTLRADPIDGRASSPLSLDEVDDSVDFGSRPAQVVKVVAAREANIGDGIPNGYSAVLTH